MMATVPHVTSGLELRKFQADGFLLTRVYIKPVNMVVVPVQFRIENLLNTSQKRYPSIQLVRFRLKRLKRKKKKFGDSQFSNRGSNSGLPK